MSVTLDEGAIFLCITSCINSVQVEVDSVWRHFHYGGRDGSGPLIMDSEMGNAWELGALSAYPTPAVPTSNWQSDS
jgi:hypothetical protein